MYFQDLATPWLAILTSPAVWATSAAHFANNWGFYTMLTCLPTYMKDILKFDIKSVCIYICTRISNSGIQHDDGINS